MSDLDESFARLLGRQATDAERQNLHRVKDALGLKTNDALWLVLMALEHHKSQYETFPERLAEAARHAVAHVKTTAEAAMQAAAQTTKADLAKAVAASAQEAARDVAGKDKARWIAASAALVALSFGALLWIAHLQSTARAAGAYEAGYERGRGEGYNAAKDEKAAALWGATPEGQRARRLAETGDLQKILHCDNKHWRNIDGFCVPFCTEGSKNMRTGLCLSDAWKIP